MKILKYFYVFFLTFSSSVRSIPSRILYEFNIPDAKNLPPENDISSEEITLKVPIVFYGVTYSSIYVNSNGFLSFQTEIPQFINIEFPLDYPIIAPFYSNVDTTSAGTISFYETQDPALLNRATENVHENFLDSVDFQTQSIFIATWNGVGYYNNKADKLNTYQVVLITNGKESYAEFLYPENGLQWIQGSGDESGLPDARAQVGFLSPEGKIHTLPGSATEQVQNLEKWTNTGLPGQFIFKISDRDVTEPDAYQRRYNQLYPLTCAEVPTACHSKGNCIDYKEGFCCQCKPTYFGNGKFCIKNDLPLRVSGKVNGKLNGERLENLDLQSYVVTADGRAYTAISKVPESLGADIQTLQILGSVIGYLFAVPIRGAVNGFQKTGGVLNNSATITFLNNSQVVHITQKFYGLDVFDHLKVEIDIQGYIPTLPADARIIVDEYQEQYTQTAKNLIQMSSERTYSFNDGREIVNRFKIEQSLKFNTCPFDNDTVGESWNLKVGRNFISYESREQIIRFGISNKITPIGDFDPCNEGRQTCGENSACVVEGTSFECVCNPGFQKIFSENIPTCVDINECQVNHDCDYNAECGNNVGSYHCTCNPGFEGDGKHCLPVSSCQNVTCLENAECVEVENQGICRCLAGFRGDGYNCQPVKSQTCEVHNNCSPYGICSIDPRTDQYSCICHPGFQGDGYYCIPLPVTSTETPAPTYIPVTEPIRPNQVEETCLEGGLCWCPAGYVKDSDTQSCRLSGETAQYRGGKPALLDPEEDFNYPEVQCFNSSLCFCPYDYFYSKRSNTCIYNKNLLKINVINIKGIASKLLKNDCRTLHNCDYNARCTYNEVLQGHICTCNDGFEGDGFTCREEDETCTTSNDCHTHASCTYDDSTGNSKCICNSGFSGNGYNCIISAVCTSDSDCHDTESCVFQQDKYECLCKEGYVRDSQHVCVPIEGSCGGGTCVENAECLFDEDYQTYYCTCKPGFIGDGISECKERPVGCDTLNNCGLHATCQFERDALIYVCKCNSGFFGDGFICRKERNCLVDSSLCDRNAQCLTDSERRYICKCNPGYIGNGSVCKEISRSEGNFLLLNQGWATHRIPLDGQSQGKPIQTRAYQTAVGLDIDCTEGRVYWSDISLNAIRSSLYNGSDNIDFLTKDVRSPEGLAIDWVSRNIYWTDSILRTIEVANLDSKRKRKLFSTGLVNPRGIAVHPQRGKIFWSDWYRKHPKIEWANADGTDRKTFLEGSSVSLPNSLAIDYDTEQLCYSDAGTKKIECVQIDTKQIQTIAVNCTYPFGIAITDKQIYWSDWISKKIERVDKYSLTRLTPLNIPAGGLGNKLFGLVAVPNRCLSLTNLCQFTTCPEEHICLPDGKGSKSCLCSRRSDTNDEPNCVI